MLDFTHKPVLLAEVLAVLSPAPGRRYADGTVGGGGHASAILQASAPDGWLFGCDRDGEAIEAAAQRLAGFSGRYELRQGPFSDLAEWVPPRSCDGVLLDLGVSSAQLERPERGFAFLQDGPLDMRMDRRQSLRAGDVVEQCDADELARIFRELGDEPRARQIARIIVNERRQRPIRTTRDLAELVERRFPPRGDRIHPVTRVFQALRMVVNDELRLIQEGLQAAWEIVKPGGRLAVISFHSTEDRLVKEFGRRLSRDYTFPGEVDVPELRIPTNPEARWLYRKPIRPQEAEVRDNRRARSAQLRVLEKI